MFGDAAVLHITLGAIVAVLLQALLRIDLQQSLLNAMSFNEALAEPAAPLPPARLRRGEAWGGFPLDQYRRFLHHPREADETPPEAGRTDRAVAAGWVLVV